MEWTCSGKLLHPSFAGVYSNVYYYTILCQTMWYSTPWYGMDRNNIVRQVKCKNAFMVAVVTCYRHLQGNLLLAGHANGDIVFWEFKRTGWETVKAFKDAHSHPVTSATFVESAIQLALTGDAQGRLVSHNVTAYLSITAIFAGVSVVDKRFAVTCRSVSMLGTG